MGSVASLMDGRRRTSAHGTRGGTMRPRAIVAAAVLGVLLIGGSAVPTLAKDGDVIRRGACSGTSDWKLKLSEEDGRIEVEYEVDQNRVGDTWRVRIRHDDDLMFAGTR